MRQFWLFIIPLYLASSAFAQPGIIPQDPTYTVGPSARSFSQSLEKPEAPSAALIENCQLNRSGGTAAWFACQARRDQELSAQKQAQFQQAMKSAEDEKNPLVQKLHEEYDGTVHYPDYCFTPGNPGYAAPGLSDTQLRSCIEAKETSDRQNQLAVNRQETADSAGLAARLARLPDAAKLTALAPCPQGRTCNGIGNPSGSDAMYYKIWSPWIRGETGFSIKVDLASVLANNNGWAAVFAGVPKVTSVGDGMRLWAFDCKGHMSDLTGGPSPLVDVAPQSLMGAASKIVCGTLQRDRVK